jgi:hypothetical protein
VTGQSPLSDAPANPSDEQLVTLAQGGDRRALEQLVTRHGPWIFNVAARMVWRRDDAADVTQEVLVKVITRLSTFRGEERVPHVALPDRRQPRHQPEEEAAAGGVVATFRIVRARSRRSGRGRPIDACARPIRSRKQPAPSNAQPAELIGRGTQPARPRVITERNH